MTVACVRPDQPISIFTPSPTEVPTIEVNPDLATVVAGLTPSATASSEQISTPSPEVTSEPTPCSLPDEWVIYNIQAFDTLFSLAAQTSSTVDEIKNANCLENDLIVVGEPLFLPSIPPSPIVGPGEPPPPSVEPVCSKFKCPDRVLDDDTWPVGGPNFEFDPCEFEPRTQPWISFENEEKTLPDGVTLDPERYDRELGERSYYYLCYPKEFFRGQCD